MPQNFSRDAQPLSMGVFGRPFECPSCGLSVEHRWTQIHGIDGFGFFEASRCSACGHNMLWRTWFTPTLKYVGEVVYPRAGGGPPPPLRLSRVAQADYNEARAIADASPRAAAALLRLVVSRVCAELASTRPAKGGDGVALADTLVEAKLLGSEAVAPGVLHGGDDANSVAMLFEAVHGLCAMGRPAANAD